MGKKTIRITSALEKIKNFYYTKNRMPSFLEISKLFNYSSKGAARYLVNKLISSGYLKQDPQGKLLPNNLLGNYALLGSIKAGFPSPAEEELQDNISFDQYLIKKPESTYLVTVEGDSMIDSGIMPGDLVIVEKGRQAKTGDIVIAEVDNEWTMKYLDKKDGKVRLIPANKNYQPIIPKENLKIGGVVIGVVRKY